MVTTKKFLIIGLLCSAAVVGIVLGLVFGLKDSNNTTNKTSPDASQKPDGKDNKPLNPTESLPPTKPPNTSTIAPSTNFPSTGAPTTLLPTTTGPTTKAPTTTGPTTNVPSTTAPTTTAPTSNFPTTIPTTKVPTSDSGKDEFLLHALAIGDWGSTMEKPGSCCNFYRKTELNSPSYYKDYLAQSNVAHLMSLSAARLKPKVIIGHGDNFYWTGVFKGNVQHRFDTTFEEVYSHPSLKNIEWVNVLGNHDYGGSSYICGENRPSACKSTEELLKYLRLKFELQKSYKSPNRLRWKLPDHYYVHRIEEGGISIDIFNVDTNFADSHAARQICCQCYGYSNGGNGVACSNVNEGSPYCAGGNKDMYRACMKEIEKWWEQSLEGLDRDAAESTADWKIVNSHYSPHFHMSPPKMKRWYNLLNKRKINVFINGHTHGENHDYGNFPGFGVHFFENGAGGGIQSQASGNPPPYAINEGLKNIWIGGNVPYGFFEISASKTILRMRFVTFDQNWQFDSNPQKVKRGGSEIQHCWHIPKDGSYGHAC